MIERTGGDMRKAGETIEPNNSLQERLGWNKIVLGDVLMLNEAWNRPDRLFPVDGNISFEHQPDPKRGVVQSGESVQVEQPGSKTNRNDLDIAKLEIQEEMFMAWWETGFENDDERELVEKQILGTIDQQNLSARELAVLWMRCRGKSHSDIARTIGLSPSCTRHLASEIGSKLSERLGGVTIKSKISFVVTSVKSGLVPVSLMQNNFDSDVINELADFIDENKTVGQEDSSEHISVLNTVYETGSYTAAAKKLGVTEARVRKKIFELKEMMGLDNPVEIIFVYSVLRSNQMVDGAGYY